MKIEEISYEQYLDLAKDLVVLLLRIDQYSIRSKIHLQKELFLLTESFPKFKQIFDFKTHYYGVYSDLINNIVENNFDDLFTMSKKRIELTIEGQQYSEHALKKIDPTKRERLLKVMKMIRSIYDKTSEKELMFLMYFTYGHTEKSEILDNLLKEKKILAKSLLRKNVISQKKYNEMIGEPFETNS